MSWLKANETDIIDRLKGVITTVPVKALPEKSFKFIHPQGTVLVMFVGMGVGEKIGPMAQGVSLKYEVAILSRSLHSQSGLYPLIESTLGALLGFKPSHGTTPLSLERAQSADLDDSAWGFSMTFSTDSVLVPCLDNDPEADAPPMTNISFANCGHECEDC